MKRKLKKFSDKLMSSAYNSRLNVGYPENCFFLRISIPGDPHPYVVKEINDDEIKVFFWGEGNDPSYKKIEINKLSSDFFSGYLSYKGQHLNFNGLKEIDSIRISFFKAKVSFFNKFASASRSEYKAYNLTIKNQLNVLKVVVDGCLNFDKDSIGIRNIMRALHGESYLHHPRSERLSREVKLYLDAFVRTGDLERDGSLFRPTGQAVLTIKKMTEDERKHKESHGMQRKMLFTAILSFLAAAASALTSYLSYIKPHP